MLKLPLGRRSGAARLSFALVLGAGAAHAQSSAAADRNSDPVSANGVYQEAALGGLRGSARPKDAVLDALMRFGAGPSTLNTLADTTIDDVDSAGLHHVQFNQRVVGMRVYGGYARAAFSPDGSLVHLIDRILRFGSDLPNRPIIGDEEALTTAIGRNFGAAAPRLRLSVRNGFVSSAQDDPFFFRPPTVERVVIAGAGGLPEIGFLVETWSARENLLYHTVINGVGQVISNDLRTHYDSYKVFPVHPSVNPTQSTVAGPGDAACGTGKWLATNTQNSRNISGCNARSYLDIVSNNSPDTGGTSITTGNFLATANLTQSPTSGSNPDVSVQNLFYQNNVIHDRLYTAGFTEAWRNFQVSNGSNGGIGNDPVLAEALDGSGTNNANFATPVDGTSPRMQMFQFTLTSPNRDSALDADVIYHEYGHGLTWRIVGDMGGESVSLGEGFSDAVSIVMTNNDVEGEYITNNINNGIRSKRYALHTRTLSSYLPNSFLVHYNGEIYAAAIWRLWEIYQGNGLSADTLLADIVGGLKQTPAKPTYIQARDGMLAAAPSTRDCLIWIAFAAKGMGQGATMTSAGVVSQSLTVPSSCTTTPQFKVTDVNVSSEGSALNFTVTRSGSLASLNSVSYATQNETAIAGSDYTAKSGILNFAANETTKTVSVPTLIDTNTTEPDEFLWLKLSASTGGAIVADSAGRGGIGGVNQAPLAIADGPVAVTLQANAAYDYQINVIANDSDPDGGTVSVISVTSASGGVSVGGPSTVRFVGEAPAGTQTITGTYTIRDSGSINDSVGKTASTTVKLKVTGLCGQVQC